MLSPSVNPPVADAQVTCNAMVSLTVETRKHAAAAHRSRRLEWSENTSGTTDSTA
jgi:hypothetical protein